MKKNAFAAIFTLLLLVIAVSPANAGKVTLNNNTSTDGRFYCTVTYETYILGVRGYEYLDCVAPGKGTWVDDVWYSVGVIHAKCTWNATPRCAPASAKKYDHTISGTWLPSRKFSVTVTGGANPDDIQFFVREDK